MKRREERIGKGHGEEGTERKERKGQRGEEMDRDMAEWEFTKKNAER